MDTPDDWRGDQQTSEDDLYGEHSNRGDYYAPSSELETNEIEPDAERKLQESWRAVVEVGNLLMAIRQALFDPPPPPSPLGQAVWHHLSQMRETEEWIATYRDHELGTTMPPWRLEDPDHLLRAANLSVARVENLVDQARDVEERLPPQRPRPPHGPTTEGPIAAEAPSDEVEAGRLADWEREARFRDHVGDLLPNYQRLAWALADFRTCLAEYTDRMRKHSGKEN